MDDVDVGYASPMNHVGFHTDGTYILDQFLPREDNSVTLWIALDDADEETGCMQYVEGSHFCL